MTTMITMMVDDDANYDGDNGDDDVNDDGDTAIGKQ